MKTITTGRNIIIEYRGIKYKKNQEVKFIVPTDYRIVDPQTKENTLEKG